MLCLCHSSRAGEQTDTEKNHGCSGLKANVPASSAESFCFAGGSYDRTEHDPKTLSRVLQRHPRHCFDKTVPQPNKFVTRPEDVLESYSAAVTTSLHDSKGNYQLSSLHEVKPGEHTTVPPSLYDSYRRCRMS